MEDKVQSIVRAFLILEVFENYPDGVSLTEIGKKVGLHKSTVHRLLNTLIYLGYVRQNEDSKYCLTYKLYDIASSSFRSLDYTKIVHEHMKLLSKDINEVLHLVIEDGTYAVYIDKIDADNAITMGSKIGRRIPLVRTSVGKAIMSNYSNEKIKDIWDKSEIEKITDNTIVDFDIFMKEIDNIRLNHIAVDNEENEIGIYCIGTSIYDRYNKLKGAISITGPKERMMSKLKEQALKEKLLLLAKNISKDII